ncbi:hypothetical protein SESBI_35474 [Sesbania bispinosa]|nr:hypothetical protein SESBI_35474 [Sesbania bispinosa]
MGAEGSETENNKVGKREKRGERQPRWGDHGHYSSCAGARINGGHDSEIATRRSMVEAKGENVDATVRPRTGGGARLRRRRSFGVAPVAEKGDGYAAVVVLDKQQRLVAVCGKPSGGSYKPLATLFLFCLEFVLLLLLNMNLRVYTLVKLPLMRFKDSNLIGTFW